MERAASAFLAKRAPSIPRVEATPGTVWILGDYFGSGSVCGTQSSAGISDAKGIESGFFNSTGESRRNGQREGAGGSEAIAGIRIPKPQSLGFLPKCPERSREWKMNVSTPKIGCSRAQLCSPARFYLSPLCEAQSGDRSFK